MNGISKIPVSLFVTTLVLALVAKTVATALFWFLPLEGVEPKKRYSFTPDFVRIDLARSFGFGNKTTTSSSGLHVDTASYTATASISSMVLKGLYGNEKKGFALVAEKGSPNKITIVAVGEKFEGYTLKSIIPNGVIFTKDGKEFILKLKKSENPAMAQIHSRNENDVHDDETLHTVDNDDVQYFAKHPREIWKNISIQERRKAGRIEGFEVKWIKPGSKFATLGLHKGDLIIKANNKRLQSYKDAIDIYRKIDKLDEVSIVVLRNNQEKELVYEINH